MASSAACDGPMPRGIVGAMLTLTTAGQALDRRCLSSEGAFCWWYGDVVDGEGNGVVVIGAFALPFLERRDTPTMPASRPSITVAVYERGICTFYALLELSDRSTDSKRDGVLQETCSWRGAAPDRGEGERWTFGKSTLGYDIADGKGRFFADLDLETPTGSLRGRFDIAGPARDPSGHGPHTLGTPPTLSGPLSAPPGGVAHDWCPQLGPADGRAALVIDGARRVDMVGSGYHDRNGALLPLWKQGIDHWLWARADVVVDGRRQSRIVYVLWPDDGGAPCGLGVISDDDGATRVCDVSLVDVEGGSTWLGMGEVRAFRAIDGAGQSFLTGRVAHRVDDGPFYLRHTLRAGVDGGDVGDAVCGYVEVVDVKKIDTPWQRPFVRMRVSPSDADHASLWNPLFSGSRSGRVGRQLRWLMGQRS